MPSNHDRPKSEQPEQTREEIELKIREAIARNRVVFDRMAGMGADVAEYDRLLAEALERDGQPVKLSFRQSDGQIASQWDMYITWIGGDLIEMQYFHDDGTFGEPCSIWIKDIVSIESAPQRGEGVPKV